MYIPLLHPWWQFLLQPLLCHYPVLLALLFCQLPLNLTASSTVAREVVQRSWRAFQKLKCQIVYSLLVHRSKNLTVHPFSGTECRFIWSPFNFSVQMLANKLEISKNSIM